MQIWRKRRRKILKICKYYLGVVFYEYDQKISDSFCGKFLWINEKKGKYFRGGFGEIGGLENYRDNKAVLASIFFLDGKKSTNYNY